MNLGKCSNGHYYDMDKFQTCPHCSNAGESNGETVRYTQPFTGSSGAALMQNGMNAMVKGGNMNHVQFQNEMMQHGTVYTGSGGAPDMNTVGYTEISSLVRGATDENGDSDANLTISYNPAVAKTNVVGWVAIIEGEDKGKSFALKSGRNFIGRSSDQDVVLANDKAVSREQHAIIVYEPRKRKFFVQPGDSRGLFYVNDNVVLGSEEIKAYDVILVGKTQLIFVPLCGDKFSWDSGVEEGVE